MASDIAAKFLDIQVSRPEKRRQCDREEAAYAREREQARMESRLKRWSAGLEERSRLEMQADPSTLETLIAARSMVDAMRALGLTTSAVAEEGGAGKQANVLSSQIIQQHRARQAARPQLGGSKKRLEISAARDVVLNTSGHRTIVVSNLQEEEEEAAAEYEGTATPTKASPFHAAEDTIDAAVPTRQATMRRAMTSRGGLRNAAGVPSFAHHNRPRALNRQATESPAAMALTPPSSRRRVLRHTASAVAVRSTTPVKASPTLADDLAALAEVMSPKKRTVHTVPAAERCGDDDDIKTKLVVPVAPATRADVRSAHRKLRGHIRRTITMSSRRVRRVRDYEEGFLPLAAAQRRGGGGRARGVGGAVGVRCERRGGGCGGGRCIYHATAAAAAAAA